MGASMRGLLSAIAWNGSDVTLCLFVLSTCDEVPPLEPPDVPLAADRVRTYELEDEDRTFGDRRVYEYDLVFQEMPGNLEGIVTAYLVEALKRGAIIAWFGFEGSFHFGYVLHPEIADQIFAVAAGEAVRLALEDDYRVSGDWGRLLGELRDRVLNS